MSATTPDGQSCGSRREDDDDRSDSEVHRFVDERLRRNGQRYTPNRRAVVDAMRAALQPLTVTELLELAPSVAQSSAYRNLVVLEEAEVVERIVTSDDFARYELTHDLSGHHHHMVCSVCGKVVDFELPQAFEADLDKVLQEATGRQGFVVAGHQLDIIGTCANCSID